MKQFNLLFGLFLVVTAHGASPPSPSGPGQKKVVLVSEAVAQVSDHVITSREVVVSYVIDQALSENLSKKASVDRTQWLLKFPSEEFKKHLAQVVLESVVQLEAENFSVGQINLAEIQSQQKHLQEMVGAWGPWLQLQVSKVELEQMTARKARAKNFLKFKMETSGVQISDEEAKAYFEKNRLKFGNLPFAQFKEGIKEVLSQEQLQEKLKDWFDILKRKYRVKFLGQYSSLGL